MASGVTRVIGRCDSAVETEILDLSECQLMQMPDAVFHLMRNTDLKKCNLSTNVLTKVPVKLALKFSNITELNLSHNRIGKLPEELGQLEQLTSLDISYNAFVSLPSVAYILPKLEILNAEKNYIADVDSSRIKERVNLRSLNLRENPLAKECHDRLSKITSVEFLISPIIEEEWEKIDSI